MATIGTAPNDSSDDRSVTEIDDRDEEHQEEEITEDSESEASVTDGLGNDVGKISELQKKKKADHSSVHKGTQTTEMERMCWTKIC
jgi:hypothetical protein